MNSRYQAVNYSDEEIEWLLENFQEFESYQEASEHFNAIFDRNKTANALRKVYDHYKMFVPKELEEVQDEPKILVYDIETAPIIAHVWRLWDQNVGLNQIEHDWHVMSWCAKWKGDDEVMYMDQRGKEDISDDKELMYEIWKLLDEADIVITQNGKSFDEKKLNARFILHGFPPPSSYRHLDTKLIAKKNFAFTSNKLAYMTDKLCTKYKKLSHAKFPGHSLWTECLKNNPEAWQEMEDYNRYDVLSLEELYDKLAPWDNTLHFGPMLGGDEMRCKCGSTDYKKSGIYYTGASSFQKYQCLSCGHEVRGTKNLLSKEKRKSMGRKVSK